MIDPAALADLRLQARARVRAMDPTKRDALAGMALAAYLVREETLSGDYMRAVGGLISDAAPSFAVELQLLINYIRHISPRSESTKT